MVEESELSPPTPRYLVLPLSPSPIKNLKSKCSTIFAWTFDRVIAMTTYSYVLASQKFLLEEEPLEEVLKERTRDYREKEKEIDFWVVKQPAFLEAPEMAQIKAKCPQPAAAIVSTNPQFITWLKLRLEYVVTGEFEAPSDSIPDPLKSLEMSQA